MELIIELPGRAAHTGKLYKFDQSSVRIGRAYDNDLILSDPHICAHHAIIEENETGQIQLKDLNSINGLYDKQHQKIDGSCVVESGDFFSLGKTRFRVFRPDHGVLPTLRLSWVEQLANIVNKPLVAGVLCILTILLSLSIQYASELSEFYLGREILASVGVLLLIAMWPACWSLMARYRKQESRFLAHLSVTLFVIILYTMVEKLDDWISFHLGNIQFINGSIVAISLIFLLCLLWFQLYLVVVMGAKKRWIYAGLFTAIFAGITSVSTSLDQGRFKSRPEYVAKLFPPSVSFYTASKDKTFLSEVEKVFDVTLEQAGQGRD